MKEIQKEVGTITLINIQFADQMPTRGEKMNKKENEGLIIGHKWLQPLELSCDIRWYIFKNNNEVEYMRQDKLKKETFIITDSQISIGENTKEICAISETYILLKDDFGYEILLRIL